MKKKSSATVVSCPTCGKSVHWTPANPWRPFCSERCKLIDLGAWFEEDRRIAGDTGPPQSDDDA